MKIDPKTITLTYLEAVAAKELQRVSELLADDVRSLAQR